MAAGEIELWRPTAATLQQLAHARDLAQIRDRIVQGPVAAPRVVGEQPDLSRILVSGAGGVPGQTANTYVVGGAGEECVIVDPGDPSDEAARAVIDTTTALGARPAVIALTHVDPDHAAGAEGLALTLGIPIVGGPGAARFVPYPVRELADGEVLAIAGAALTVIATPGPAADHVAFRFGDVVFTGDLVGGRGDRSILGSPDRAAWDRSLARLADLDATRFYPGHGEPLRPRATTPAGSGGS
jgi:glyoxylase-like metal-dependent hydrolase (beta-lactamase superfamily II)